MDAKPQRPRALRVNDENAPVSSLNGMVKGKTLHQRTKSTPAFSTLLQGGAVKAAAAAAAAGAAMAGTTNKRILGEVAANTRVARSAKDDSEVGKASPGKITLADPVTTANVTAALARPATRPLALKPSAQNTLPTVAKTASQQAVAAEPEPVKKITTKKSTKIFKDAQVAPQPEAETKNTASTASVHQTFTVPTTKYVVPIVAPSNPVSDQSVLTGAVVQRQDVHTTESVALREDPAPRPAMRSAQPVYAQVPQGFTSEEEYRTYLDYHGNQLIHSSHGMVAPIVQTGIPFLPVHHQFYDAEEEQYDYDDGFTTARSFGLPVDNTATIILAPNFTAAEEAELEQAKLHVESTRIPEDIEDEIWDTSMVAEYSDEIFSYMSELEARMTPNPRYMEAQQEIQWSMRAVLIDWIVQVHQRFNLLPETLFLTVNYIDRFLSCKIVSLGKLQLVGATAIFIAAKYEEVQCPTVSEIVYMVDGGYSADELLKAERFMLTMLQFELGWPGPMSFLRRISKADDYDLETRTLAKYFLEVTIMDERFVGCTPSYLAAGAHCMARLMIYGAGWSQAHVHYSGYTYSLLQPLLKGMLECCERPLKHHKAVYEKYTDKRFKRASAFVSGKMCDGFRLP